MGLFVLLSLYSFRLYMEFVVLYENQHLSFGVCPRRFETMKRSTLVAFVFVYVCAGVTDIQMCLALATLHPQP